jgi:alpha-tubulin suppressor-like RCC1 family protein
MAVIWSSRMVTAALMAAVLLMASAPRAGAEQAASDVRSLQAGWLDAGGGQTCAVLANGGLRCWGSGSLLGYGGTSNVGDGASATPTIGSVGTVPVGAGRTVRAVAAGGGHTCAILDDGSLRCWGFGSAGRLGYGNTNNVGDGSGPTPTIASAGPVPLGPGRTARAITTGDAHTCAILDDGSVRCWGSGGNGRLGYGNVNNVGDGVGPSIESAGPVPLDAGRTARAISAGGTQTCAILDDASLRCWGSGGLGQLGYGNTTGVGDGVGPSVAAAGPVPLGAGRTAVAIAAGSNITTCGILDDGTARCWGGPANGQLGYGNTVNNIGSGAGPTPTIESAGPLPVGAGRTVRAITNTIFHAVALLDDGTLRAWGSGGSGKLGYGNTSSIGTGAGPTPTIVSAGPVPLGEPLVATVADVSLTIGASQAALVVGGQGTVVTTMTNGGPDGAIGVAAVVQVPGLAVGGATASQGSFDASSGIWTAGTIPAGGQATLTVPVTALAPGTFTAVAELVAASAFDPDSVPANAAGEDDRAATQITVSPAGCAVLARLDAVACECALGLRRAACASEKLPRAVGEAFSRGCKLAAQARTSAPKKAKRLERGAAKSFRRVSTRVAKAAQRRKRPLSAGCASEIEAAVAEGVSLGGG